MSKQKWTQGPWANGPDPEGEYHEKISIHTADGALYVALVDGGFSAERQQANADLMTAAPDLHDALEGLVDWFDANEIDEPRLLEARAALRKARGETQ